MAYGGRYSYYRTKKHGKNDSKFEANKAEELRLLKLAGEIKDYREQVPLPLIVNNLVVSTYLMDFEIHHNDGTLEYLETKGFSTEVWKLKWKLLVALYSDRPDIKLTVEFQGKPWKPRLKKVNT